MLMTTERGAVVLQKGFGSVPSVVIAYDATGIRFNVTCEIPRDPQEAKEFSKLLIQAIEAAEERVVELRKEQERHEALVAWMAETKIKEAYRLAREARRDAMAERRAARFLVIQSQADSRMLHGNVRT